MSLYLHLRFEAPLQSWGGVAVDPRRPTDSFPRASALAGLLANALGWRHRDAEQTTALQDALDYAVREDRSPQRAWDYQTADLSELSGWTRWGPEKPGGGSAAGTHILNKEYLADGAFTVALGLRPAAPASFDEIEEALARPARPLFFGRKSCIPAGRILIGRCEARNALRALSIMTPAAKDDWPNEGPRIWCDAALISESTSFREVWDRRNYGTTRFDRSRRVAEVRMPQAKEDADG